DWSEDFFEKQTNLTVSGQLEVETACMALGDVYTFGPTFRAENSNTSRHLAEFWMVEPEMAFAEDRKSTRLNSSHVKISYAVFCFLQHPLPPLFPYTTLFRSDWSEDFFEKQTNLTVSGQLEVETACMALGDVYTFGPTFRAENSNTSRHLAEFWMVEPEMAFA